MQLPVVDALEPRPYVVDKTKRETADVFTFELLAAEGPDAAESAHVDSAASRKRAGRGLLFAPGQFNMLYAFGIGEVPISISGDPDQGDRRLVHTIREVGPVSAALGKLRKGDYVGVRGPFGSAWPIIDRRGSDIVLVAGGIGLAPLRPVVYEVLNHRAEYRRVSIVYGARTPQDLLFGRQLARWADRRDLQFDMIVDRGDADWTGPTGVVTRLLQRSYCRPERAVAMLCGPEVMMRFSARELLGQGFPPESIFVSAERNMKCAVGLCGRCQFGAHFICKDGPVFRYDKVRDSMLIREL